MANGGLPRLVVGMSGSSAPQFGVAFLRAARGSGRIYYRSPGAVLARCSVISLATTSGRSTLSR
jgi:hypothetical protein